jgi:hypothetical protein
MDQSDRFISLAETLGTTPAPSHASDQEIPPRLVDITDAKAFARAVLESVDFRQYIINGLTLGSLPAAILIRVMDLAGWQKPPERIEHTGKDGQPIETITEVRRVIVRAHDPFDEDEQPERPETKH